RSPSGYRTSIQPRSTSQSIGYVPMMYLLSNNRATTAPALAACVPSPPRLEALLVRSSLVPQTISTKFLNLGCLSTHEESQLGPHEFSVSRGASTYRSRSAGQWSNRETPYLPTQTESRY